MEYRGLTDWLAGWSMKEGDQIQASHMSKAAIKTMSIGMSQHSPQNAGFGLSKVIFHLSTSRDCPLGKSGYEGEFSKRPEYSLGRHGSSIITCIDFYMKFISFACLVLTPSRFRER